MAQETILLVPGVSLGGFEMQTLARRLRRYGYAVETFWRNPWRRPLAASAELLRERLIALDAPSVHLVAHSLGGPVVVETLRRFPDLKPGRIVTLGSPHAGCHAARRVARLPGGRWFLGPALTSIADPADTPQAFPHQVGSIAGSLNLLLGALFCPGKPNDTLVCVAETRLPGFTDHFTLFTSHTGLLLSRQVVARIHAFLQSGRFA